MALLDMFSMPGATPEQNQFMMQQGLLGLGSGLLSASGWSATPVSMGQALGQGLLGMQQGTSGAMEQMMKREQFGMLRAQQEAKAQAALDKRNAINALAGADPMQGNLDPGAQQRALATLAPDQYVKSVIGKDNADKKLKMMQDYYAYLESKGNKPPDPYFTPVTGNGGQIYSFDARKGGVAPLVDPATQQPISAPKSDPNQVLDIASAGAFGKGRGTEAATDSSQSNNWEITKMAFTEGFPDIKSILDKAPGSSLSSAIQQYMGKVVGNGEGADAQAKIAQIGGNLLQTVPIYPGSQSNVELQQRQSLLGDIQNPNVSVKAKTDMLNNYFRYQELTAKLKMQKADRILKNPGQLSVPPPTAEDLSNSPALGAPVVNADGGAYGQTNRAIDLNNFWGAH